MFKIDNEMKNANVARTIRFTESLFEKLNETAQANNISFNLLVLQCCKYALENMQEDEQ
jgi:predicted HicB family RNase H-like nuclease